MSKENGIISMLCKQDHVKVLAPSEQVLRIHRIHWKDNNVSRDWLERISSVASAKTLTTAKDTEGKKEGHSGIDVSTIPCQVELVEQKSGGDESSLDQEPFKQDLEGLCHSRKPDSTYISLVSQIHVPGSCPKTSKRRFSDGNYPSTRFISEMKCVQVKKESLSPVFFTSQANSEAKRKLSFEYIREVSKLGCELQVN